jgi:protein TonB
MRNSGPRGDYRKTLELSMMVALIVVALSFRFVTFDQEHEEMGTGPDSLIVITPEPTRQTAKERPPVRPVIPISMKPDEILEEESGTDTMIFGWFEHPPLPSLFEKRVVEEEAEVFIPYDKEPSVIGGTAFIQKHLKYPELARQAGVEGKVVVRLTIDEKGQMVDAVVMEDEAGVGFGRAALAVLQQCRFTPAMQRDRPVKVSVSIPIYFRLK